MDTANARVQGFKVTDNGPDISSDDQACLFESFWRARAGDSRGVGLALSITKDLVHALDGRLWVDSVVGKGSTFSFSLPSVQGAQI